ARSSSRMSRVDVDVEEAVAIGHVLRQSRRRLRSVRRTDHYPQVDPIGLSEHLNLCYRVNIEARSSEPATRMNSQSTSWVAGVGKRYAEAETGVCQRSKTRVRASRRRRLTQPDS